MLYPIGTILSPRIVLLALVSISTTHAADDSAAARFGSLRLGGCTRSRDGPAAARAVDAGLRLMIGFDFGRARLAFGSGHAAVEPADGHRCAMCAWGEAMALGPNLNGAATPAGLRAAHKLALEAEALLEDGAGDECALDAALVRAAVARFSSAAPSEAELALAAEAYDAAMGRAVAVAGDGADATLLYLAADAALNLSPWDYWAGGTPANGSHGAARPNAARAEALLERAIGAAPRHYGALHLKVHLLEAHATRAKEASGAADALRAVSRASLPGLAHLAHMPAHIYIRTGRYDDCVASNEAAAAAALHEQIYPQHNLEMLVWCARLAGDAAAARSGAARLAVLAEARLRAAQMEAGFGAERFAAAPLLTALSLEDWAAIAASPRPSGKTPYVRATWHLARGVRAARLEAAAEAAEGELEQLRALRRDVEAAAPSYGVFSAATCLDIYEAWLLSELQLLRGDAVAAAATLERAAATEETMWYDEPPALVLPPRMLLARARLIAQQPQRARAEADATLARFPAAAPALRLRAAACAAVGDVACALESGVQALAAWHGGADQRSVADPPTPAAAAQPLLVEGGTPAQQHDRGSRTAWVVLAAPVVGVMLLAVVLWRRSGGRGVVLMV